MLAEQQNSTFSNKKVSGKDRLDFLLKQTELFTQFLIQQKSGNNKDPELRQFHKTFVSNQRM